MAVHVGILMIPRVHSHPLHRPLLLPLRHFQVPFVYPLFSDLVVYDTQNLRSGFLK